MKVLIACEESQRVCIAFRNKGHEAYSCDTQPCSGGHPEWHMQCDVLEAALSQYWDFIGLHIPCTAMALSGNRTYAKGKPGYGKRLIAIKWSLEVWSTVKKQSKKAYLENPASVLFPYIDEPVQYIQPYQFGHGETKKNRFGFI